MARIYRSIPTNEFLAIVNANNPSDTNVFVTFADLLTTVTIIVVANYSALPAPNTVPGKFYWCEASQGTSWLPEYNNGLVPTTVP